MTLFSQYVKYPDMVRGNQTRLIMENKKIIVTHHVTDLSKLLIVGIISAVITRFYSPDYYYVLSLIGLECIFLYQITYTLVIIPFLLLEALTSFGSLSQAMLKVPRRFFEIEKELFVERRETEIEEKQLYDGREGMYERYEGPLLH